MILEWKPIGSAAWSGGFVGLHARLATADVAEAKGSDSYRRVRYARSGALLDILSAVCRLYLILDIKSALSQCNLNPGVTVK